MATTVLTPAAGYALYPFSNATVVAGGYLFHVMVDADYHIRVNRRDASTMADHGTIDLGATGLPGDAHVFPTMLIDPTDNKVVVIKSGRFTGSGDVRSCLWKSANAYGGTTEQWTANDFGASVNIPYPAAGIPAYANAVFTDNGTLAMFCSNRTSDSNGSPTGQHLMLYRYRGDGTAKTAAQLASGTWSELIGAGLDSGYGGTMYPGRPVLNGSGVGLCFTMYYARSFSLGSPYDQWGVGFIECPDLDAATLTWRKADGTAWAAGAAFDSTARADAVLVPWQGASSYHHSMVYDDSGNPRIAYALVTLTENFQTVVDSDLYVAAWDGSAWQHTLVDDTLAHYTWPFIKALYLDGTHIVIDPDGDAHAEVGGSWTTSTTPASGQPLGFAGIHAAESGENVVVSWTGYSGGVNSVQTEAVPASALGGTTTYDFDVLLTADTAPLPEFDFDVLLLADTAPLPEFDFDVLLLADPEEPGELTPPADITDRLTASITTPARYTAATSRAGYAATINAERWSATIR